MQIGQLHSSRSGAYYLVSLKGIEHLARLSRDKLGDEEAQFISVTATVTSESML